MVTLSRFPLPCPYFSMNPSARKEILNPASEQLRKWQFVEMTCGRMPTEFRSPLVGRNSLGRRSSVHAVRARPLQNEKIIWSPTSYARMPTHSPRGVLTPRPASLRAHALRYTHLSASSSTLTRRLLGLWYILGHVQGLTPLPKLFCPHAGA